MAEQNNNEVMIQLPWIVPQQPLVTTQIQVDPETKKIPLDLNVSSTDWGVVVSVIASAFISFIGFLITIYIVKKSTEAQIESNTKLIEVQSKLKIDELNIIYKHKKTEELRGLISDVSSKALLFLSQIKFNIQDNNLESYTFNSIEEYHLLQDSIARLIAYIRPGVDRDESIRIELFELLEESRALIINKMLNLDEINEFEEKLGYTQASLNIFIEELLSEKAA
ncbi:hypothetical protein GFH30_08915 [Acinetobacter wanghuae]|uniref:Uncharacterized protein n=1 Tax=Acinetobacter wanghuae TaxID=2662362 RepID=A0A5Q0P4G9_9GAMM|nr:hypothetical protein [Acinetobacter wanghuae]MQW91782.1 hypothetical protein [Acinetobacter wanghuae]QGA11503.1 hypothetical protein GFH30_08915 [Acinetobacter wanghuae]